MDNGSKREGWNNTGSPTGKFTRADTTSRQDCYTTKANRNPQRLVKGRRASAASLLNAGLGVYLPLNRIA